MEENKITEEMEEIGAEQLNEEVLKKDTYVPRPKWQIVAAWVGIAVVVTGFLLYCWHIANGGL